MWRYETKDEEAINANIYDCLASLGDTVTGNKKLYYFTGYDVLIWATMTKKVGLCIYDSTKTLENELLILINFKFYNKVKHHGTHTKMVDVNKHWCSTMEEFLDDPLLIFDSLYLSKEKRAYLENGHVCYLCLF